METNTKGDFNSGSLKAYLKEAWEKKGFSLVDGERMGISVADLVSHSKERNDALSLPFVEMWVEVLDECISWFISLNTVIYTDRAHSGPLDYFEKSCLLIVSKIIADSTAMRHLVLLGFDTSARAVLRSVSEYMEVFVAIIHDPELAKEFASTDTPEAAQRFWEKHLRGGKIRKRVTSAWKDFFGNSSDYEAAEWFANWGRDSNPLLSGVSHPSLAGGLFSLIPMKSSYSDENWLGIWGDKGDCSVFTIAIYTNFLFPVLLLSGDFPFADEKSPRPLVRSYDDENELHRHVRHGRNILSTLVLSLGSEDNRDYVFPEIDMSIWPADPLMK